jgi:DNA-binding ferritin-like protein (Dps family)
VKKQNKNSKKKMQKNNYEDRLEQLVKEYRDAKEILESYVDGSAEYKAQEVVCDKLFAKTQNFINRN